MNSLQINLNPSMHDESLLCEQLESFMLENQVKERQRFKLITCAMEGLNNALIHGESNIENIILMLHISQDKVIIDVLDSGNFTPLPTITDCPNTDNENGRGLWIMFNWMDKVSLQPTVLGTHLRLSLLR